MPRLSLEALEKRLDPPPDQGSIFLHGEEQYLRDDAATRIVGRLVDPATRDFNLDQVGGSEASPEGLASLLATPPMMAERRVVYLRDAQALPPKARDVVTSAVRAPSPGVVLVITATIPVRSKAAFYGTLEKESLSVAFPALDPVELPGWLMERAEAMHSVKIEIDAARALAAAIGAELGVLSTELRKAADYVGERDSITLDDVRAIGGYIPRVDRWAWFDAIGERRFQKALQDLPELLDSGETGVGLVIGVASHLLRLGLLVGGGREGFDRNVPPRQRWLVNRLQPQAARWSIEEIDHAIGDLLRTDRLLKSASLTDRQALEELLLRLEFLSTPPPARPGTRPARPDTAARAARQHG